jgi:DNA primase
MQLEFEETSPAQEARRKRRDRLESLLEDAASFYSRYLWDTSAGEPVRAYLEERGLTEEVCRDFRLGLSPGGDRLAAKARAKGYSREELVAAGLVNRRGNDYFAGRLLFPLSNARGRVLGFGARRLHEDDPIRAKYVNSPEGELFRKSRIVYGLHRARATIAKQDEAVVVEGYTDVLALHQRGRQTAVASMGTALTDDQLKELGHLTKRLFLCFDADAAGEAATLRGMDLAAARGFQVRVVPLPPGIDPAEAADSFDDLLAGAVGYLRHRAEAEIGKGGSRQEQFARVQAALVGLPDSPDREEAVRFAADALGLSPDMQGGLAPRAQRKTGVVSRRALEGGDRLEKRLLAAVAAEPELVEHYLAPLDERHFDDPLHRRLRAYLCGEIEADEELLRARAELDATAETEHLGAETAKELFLRLEERMVRRELGRLKGDDLERTLELQKLLATIHDAQQAPT